MPKETTAYVLIECKLGEEKRIVEELKKVDYVKESVETFGEYDIFVKMNGGLEGVKYAITNKIRKITDVKSTLTVLENPELTQFVSGEKTKYETKPKVSDPI